MANSWASIVFLLYFVIIFYRSCLMALMQTLSASRRVPYLVYYPSPSVDINQRRNSRPRRLPKHPLNLDTIQLATMDAC